MAAYPIAVLGAGPAGRGYIRDMSQVPRLKVVGLTNRSEERRNTVAKEFKVPGFVNLADLLANVEEKPQAVVIASANSTHADFAIEALAAGLHVFCEKPMAMTLDDCEAMVAAEAKSGKVLQVGFEYRYGSMTWRLHELQEAGHFGDLKQIYITDSRGHWLVDNTIAPEDMDKLDPKRGGGPMIHCGILELDLMRFYAGDVEELQAFVPQHVLPWYPSYCPDQMTIQMRFATGVTGSFQLFHNIGPTWYHPMPKWVPKYHEVPGHHLDLILAGTGGCGYARIYGEELHLAEYDADLRETRYLRTESFGHHHPDTTHHNMSGMAIDFMLAMAAGKGALHSAEDSLKTTKLGLVAQEAIDQAIASGWTSERLLV